MDPPIPKARRRRHRAGAASLPVRASGLHTEDNVMRCVRGHTMGTNEVVRRRPPGYGLTTLTCANVRRRAPISVRLDFWPQRVEVQIHSPQPLEDTVPHP